jgi:hypothetical protein
MGLRHEDRNEKDREKAWRQSGKQTLCRENVLLYKTYVVSGGTQVQRSWVVASKSGASSV